MMRRGNRTGSALVVTMMILVILTAAGLYAVVLSTSGNRVGFRRRA